MALGKLIPFGVGVAVGGTFNYITMKAFASSARKYFALKGRASTETAGQHSDPAGEVHAGRTPRPRH